MRSNEIKPHSIAIAQQELDDLKQRLALTRWPEKETPNDWTQGTPLAYAKALTDYWAHHYDWRQTETALNRYPHFITEIDGLDVHFLHATSAHKQAKPLILSHGWPGSVLEFMKVIDPLIAPTRHGGTEADAFHVVVPSLPGFGFSGKPDQSGWGVDKIAGAFAQLMARLGYDRYLAQGGDWGSMITSSLGAHDAEHCAGIHLNMPMVDFAQVDMTDLTEEEQSGVAALAFYRDWDSGYSKQQSTRPQTIGYGLVDSPVGLMSWIVEKFYAWTDSDGDPENVLSKDEMLGNVMIYWLNAAGASSARLYWESFGKNTMPDVNVPSAVSVFPKEIFRLSKRWAQMRYKNLVYWNKLDKGGHFAAFEQPECFVAELRQAFGKMPL